MFYTDDPVRDAERHDADQNKWLEKMPVCVDCLEHIQDELAFYYKGEWVCHNCMSSYEREVMPE